MKQTAVLFCCLIATGASVFAQEKKQPPPPPPPPKVEIVNVESPVIISDENLERFYQRNPDVSEIVWPSKNVVEIRFKDKQKKEETYNLGKKEELATFKEKYGDVPGGSIPPPPPPPPKKKKETI